MVVSVPRIELYPADFVGIQTLAYLGSILPGTSFGFLVAADVHEFRTDEDDPNRLSGGSGPSWCAPDAMQRKRIWRRFPVSPRNSLNHRTALPWTADIVIRCDKRIHARKATWRELLLVANKGTPMGYDVRIGELFGGVIDATPATITEFAHLCVSYVRRTGFGGSLL